ncbi:hypothetical protein LXL04_012618 [Taraxacum kok-saghyz]
MPHTHCGVPVRIIGIEFLTQQRMRAFAGSLKPVEFSGRLTASAAPSLNVSPFLPHSSHDPAGLIPPLFALTSTGFCDSPNRLFNLGHLKQHEKINTVQSSALEAYIITRGKFPFTPHPVIGTPQWRAASDTRMLRVKVRESAIGSALHEEGLERRTTKTIEINSFARQLFDIMPERVFVDIESTATESLSAGCGLSVGWMLSVSCGLSVGWVQLVSCGVISGLGVITRELINSFPSLVPTTRSCGGAQLQYRSRCKGQLNVDSQLQRSSYAQEQDKSKKTWTCCLVSEKQLGLMGKRINNREHYGVWTAFAGRRYTGLIETTGQRGFTGGAQDVFAATDKHVADFLPFERVDNPLGTENENFLKFQSLSQTSSDLLRDFGNPNKHGFRNTYLKISLIKHLSSFFGYQHFRLCKCAFDNPNLLHLSWF